MARAFLAIATMAGLAVGQGRAQEPASGPSPDVPELAVFSVLVGKWDSRFDARPIGGVTEGGARKGTAEAEWIHGGRFLRQTWTMEPAGAEPGMSGSTIMTYDPARKAYRSWQFHSTGSTSDGEGSFDEKTKVMTWTARDSNGFRIVTKSSIDADGAETWSITVTDTDGKVVADLKGKNTRRKT